MANRTDTTTIDLPIVLRDRLLARRVHPRQAMYEVVEDALDWLDECERRGGGAAEFVVRMPFYVDPR